ncbi:glycosyltransferase [Gammaproteobacteria bacterium]|nr:glycosyltransferase [Gammaproteobacteria bacterium]MDC1361325.1 glycosyltransferase [Gammaproteobacteria bacterium]
MHKIPGVSVIMSVFNGEDFLADAIKSVLHQTFTNFEFIIVDDGSNDRSLAIIQSFQELDSRIKILAHKNQGLARSLNIGIEHSKGKYIARIDADDLCYESRLEKQYAFMEENHAVDLIGSSVDVINEDGSITTSKKQITDFENIFKKRFLLSPILHITFFGKRSFFERNNGYRDSFVFAQDYDLVLRGIDSGSIILNMEEQLVQYRDFRRKINPSKFIQQFRITELAIRLSRERSKFGKEVSDLNLEFQKIKKVKPLEIFMVNIFLKTYFLDYSLKNKALKNLINILVFIINPDLRRLLVRDFRAYKLSSEK